jgi:nitroreductase
MKRKMGFIKTIKSLFLLLRGKPRIPHSLEDNELLKLILNRRSVRSFSDRLIGEDVFSAILEAGRLAPSTVNLQTWSFAVFDAESWKQTFGHSIPFRGSRAVIIITDTFRARLVLDVFPYSPLVEHTTAVMNASLAAMNMNIAAEALGVSSVMLSETGRTGFLDARYLKEKLNLPENTIPIMTMVFGYSRGSYPPMPPKIPMEQIVFYGKYHPPEIEIMQSWVSQMTAGYKVSHPGSSFEKQVQIYKDKIGQAEQDLQEMIYPHEDIKNS